MKPKVSNTGGVSVINAFKMEMTDSKGKPLPRREWKEWKPKPHQRQADMDAYRSLPSRGIDKR